MKTKTHRSRGFSLPELLMALTIIAVMAAYGVQGWGRYRQALRLEQQAQRLVDFLSREQANAYWRNQNRAVRIIQQQDDWCLQSTEEGNRECRSHADVSLASATHSTLNFYGVRNTAQAGHLVLTNAAGSVRVVISARGRIRLCGETRPVLAIPLC